MGIEVIITEAVDASSATTQEIIDKKAGEKIIGLKTLYNKVEAALTRALTQANIVKTEITNEGASQSLINEAQSFIDISTAIVTTLQTEATNNPTKYEWIN